MKKRVSFMLMACMFAAVSAFAQVTSLPYSYGFENDDALEGYTKAKTVYDSDPTWGGTFPQEIRGYTTVTHGGSQTSIEFKNGDCILVTPQFDVDLSTARIRFWAQGNTSSSSVSMEVGVMSDPEDEETFVSLSTLTGVPVSSNSSVMKEYVISLEGATNGEKYIAFYFKNSLGSGSYYIDDITVEELPACSAITGTLSYSGLSYDEVTFSFEDAGDATAWILYYKSQNDEDYTEVSLSDKSYTLTGLTAKTNYSAYVTRDCGSEGVGEASNTVTFKTPADPSVTNIASIPWFDDFEDGIDNWTIITSNSSGFPNLVNYGPASYSTTHALESKQGETMIALPALSSSIDITTLRLKFYHRVNQSGSNAGKMEIGTVTDLSDASTFTAFTTVPNHYGGEGSFEEYAYDFTSEAAGTTYIVLHFTSTGEASWYVDDMTLELQPDCPKISGTLACTTSDNESATIKFTDSEEESSWVLYYKASTGEDYIVVDIYDTVYTIENLESSTSYTAYVTRTCSNPDAAEKSNILNFMTTAVPYDLDENGGSYTMGFEEEETMTGWAYQSSNTTNVWTVGSADKNSGEKSLYVSNDNGTSRAYSTNSSTYAYASFLVKFGNSAEYTLSFDYKGSMGDAGYDRLRVYVVDGSAELPNNGYPTGDYLLQCESQSDWASASYILEEVQNTTKQIVFMFRCDGSYGTSSGAPAIDNMVITGADCGTPTSLAVSGAPETDNFTVTWNQAGDISSWKVYYKKTTDAEWEVASVSGEPTYTIDNLDGDTYYQVKVTALCGSEESAATEAITVHTACVAIATTPWQTGFEDGYTLDCWTLTASATWQDYDYSTWSYVNVTYPKYVTGADNCFEGTTALEFKSNDAGTEIIALPQFAEDIDLTQMRLQFMYRTNEQYGYGKGTFDVGYLTNVTDANTFVSLAALDATDNGVWLESETFLTDLPEEATHLALKYTTTSSNYGYTSWYVDNIKVATLPTCMPIVKNSLELVDASDNDATIKFTDTYDHTAWKVYYKKQGSSDEPSVATNVTSDNDTKSVTLTNLESNTYYNVYVTADCGNGDESDPSYTFTFVTKTSPVSVPYIQGFEDDDASLATTDFAFLSNGDAWNVGADGKKDGEKGLYTTKGSSNTMSATATLNVQFNDKAEHTIAFDYNGGGSSYYEGYIRAYLVPTNVEVTSSMPNDQYAISDKLSASEWTHFEYTANNLANQNMQLVLGYYDQYGYAYDAQVDNLVINGSDCAKPSDITYNTDENSITLSWTNNTEGATTKVNYRKVAGEDEQEAAYTAVTVTGSTYKINNLESETYYEIYLSVDCGDGETNQTAVVTAKTTTSNYITLGDEVYEIDFEDATKYSLTNVGKDDNNWIVDIYAGDSALANNSLYVTDNDSTHEFHYTPGSSGYSSSYASVFAAIPVKFADKNEYEISFDHMVGGVEKESYGDYTYGYLSAYLVPASIDLTKVDEIDKSTAISLIENQTDASDWKNVTTIAQGVAGGVYNLVFEWRYRDSYYYEANPPAAIDNIVIKGFDCARPTNLDYSNVTEDGMTLTWKENGTTDTWVLAYGTSTDNMSEVTVNSTNATINGKNVSFDIDSLKSGANYYFNVRAVCGEDSQPTENIMASTLGKRVKEFPYFLHFENADSNNTIQITGTGVNKFYIGEATGVDDTYGDGWTHHSLYLSDDGGESFKWSGNVAGTTSDAYATMGIQFGDDEEYSIEFDYIASGHEDNNYLRVRLIGEDNEIINIVEGDEMVGVNTWTHKAYKVTGVANKTYDLQFYWRNNTSNHINPGAAVDNIRIIGSSCSSVKDLRVDKGHKIYTTSLPLNWYDPHPDHTSWTVEYNESGQTPTSFVTEDTNIVINNLITGTKYEIRVYANCVSDDDTTLSVPTFLSVWTDCEPLAAGWSDNFAIDRYNNRATPICWTRLVSSLGANYYGECLYPSIITYAATGHDASNASTGTGDATSMEWKNEGTIATPYFENIENGLFTFWIMHNWYSTSDNVGIRVYVANDIWDTNTWEPITFLKANDMGNWNYNTMGQVQIPFNDIISTGTKAVILKSENPGTTYSYYMDDFRLLSNDGISPCENNVTLSLTDGEVSDEDGLLYAADENTATVTWTTTGYEKKWDYKINLHGMWQTTSDSTATFNNLIAGNEYTVYVRSHCFDINPKYDDNDNLIGYDTVDNGNVSPWKALTFVTAGDNPLFCPEVTSIEEDSVTDATVSVSWSIETAYATNGVDIMITQDDNPQYNAYDGNYITVKDSTHYTFTTTSEGYAFKQLTDYNVYIRSHCANSVSAWDTLHVKTAKAFLHPFVNTNVATVGATTSASAATATLSGMVNKQDGTVSERGFVYWKTVSPASTLQTVVSDDETSTFTATVTTLTPATDYTYYAYAKIEENDSVYKGADQTFSTLEYVPVEPTVSAVTVSDINDHSATFSATFTQTDEVLTERGFVFYRTATPNNIQTIALSGTATSATVDTLGDYVDYTVYAYAKTAYYTNGINGESVEFKTDYNASTVIDPEVEAKTILEGELDTVSAILRAEITNYGQNITITKIGFAYGQKGSTQDTITLTSPSSEFMYKAEDLIADRNYEYVAWVETSTKRIHSAKVDFHTPEGVFIAPTVITLAADGIDSTHATLHATITEGSQTITAKGFKYAISGTTDTITKAVSGDDISSSLVNLEAGTTYTFRAFATTKSGTFYGQELFFVTDGGVIVYPTVQTYAATSVTATSATLNGRVSINGINVNVTEKGFAYKIKGQNAVTEQCITTTNEQFSFDATGLNDNTNYVYYTYAKIGADTTIVGEEQEFTTLVKEVVNPVVVTGNATSDQTSITLNATVTKGDKDIEASGFNYREKGTNSWKTVASNVANGAMTATVEGLTPDTEYEYRAFVTTEDNTFNGDVKSVSTKPSSLTDAENSVSLIAYPNPTVDNAVLNVEGLSSDAKVIVVDVNGRVISETVLPQGQTTMEIKSENFAKGVYYIRVISGEINKTLSLIKQ
ncbi:MAG: fibronectin type III domain-containing protein [Bacteroidales bacterium]|nr:fibronectin type III domain-containing protein [Bacteroidales bacterium]